MRIPSGAKARFKRTAFDAGLEGLLHPLALKTDLRTRDSGGLNVLRLQVAGSQSWRVRIKSKGNIARGQGAGVSGQWG